MINLTFVDLLYWPMYLLAQAGGGGSFGSGGGGGGFGGGGGGFGGGGEGGGEAIAWLIYLSFRYPQYGIPAWIIIGVIIYYSQKAGKEIRITRTIRKGRKVQELGLREQAIQNIQQRDPGFDKQTFLKRVTNGFVTTQIAWSDQDLRKCRAFISDGVRERFDLYIAMQKTENIRNRIKNVSVTRCDIVSVTSDHHFDTIHVRFTASAISYNEDLTTGKRVSGNSAMLPISFTEIWSFSRRPGAKTNTEASVLQGRCPNCGGPVEIVDKAECPQCKSIVNSGQYDWVLAEITQDEEWVVPPVKHAVAGWDEIQQRDPGLNFQHLEDRASVIFWRSIMAVYFNDIKYAAPILHKSCSKIPKAWAPAQGIFWKTPAVGVVEVTQCIPARDDAFDRILVLVRWSATRATGDRKRPVLHGHQRIYSHVLFLKRRSDVKTQSGQAFASFGCSSCGAPIDVGGAKACHYCGAILNDGTNDWVLEDVGPANMMEQIRREDDATRILEQGGGVERLESDRLLNEPELLTALARILTVDGELHEKERQHILEFAQRRGIPKDRLKAVFATATSQEIAINLPTDIHQGRAFMDHLLRAALVDGKVTRSEHETLLQACQQIGWSATDLKMAMAKTRRELYQQARAILRNQKKSK